MAWERNVIIKSDHEIELMRQAGSINAKALAAVREAIRPGVTTAALDAIAEQVIRDHGAEPAFLQYPGPYPYPATINASFNEQMVHGIPGKRRVQEGDILAIDCGAVYEGYVSDAAFTVAIGDVSAEARKLLEVTEQALMIGIQKMRLGNRTGDVSAAIQEFVEGHGFHVPREYTGHGVGRTLHEGPQVPNYGYPGRGMALRKGITVAIEPMVLVGTSRTTVQEDQWTVSSSDGSLTAHFEHTVAVTDGDPLVLTALDGRA